METTNCGKKRCPFGLVLLLLTVSGVLLYWGSDRLVDTTTPIARGYQILARLDAIQLLLQEDQSIHLAFLATNNTAILERSEAVADKLKNEFDSESNKILADRKSLVSLIDKEFHFSTTNDDELEKKRSLIEDLQKLIHERRGLVRSIVNEAAGETARRKGAEELVDGKGKEISQRIEAKLAEMRHMEETPLQARLAEVRHSAQWLGDIVVAIHFVYIGIVVVGLILILLGGACRWQWVRNLTFRCIHLTMILIVVVEAILNIECPLTTWERDLKLSANMKKTEGGFIARWMHQIVQRDINTNEPENQRIFEIAYMCFGAVVLASFWLVPPRRCKNAKENALAPENGVHNGITHQKSGSP